MVFLLTKVTFYPQQIDEVLTNPYMGFAPAAGGGPYSQLHSLVYANFTWRELESKKGIYDFATIEKKYKLDYWRGKNVKLIFRIVLDYPRSSVHRDIPDWLYDEIKGDGTSYTHEWGNGFSPNYDNKILISYHEKLIQKLAERYNDDPAIAFIPLGSIGHWGEWHTLQQDGIYIPFPKISTTEIYVNQYLQYFNKKILLMRRPAQIALNHKLGLFNDVFGSQKDTDEFWGWVKNGYTFWLTKEKNPAMPDFWKYAPSGGEFSSYNTLEQYFSKSKLSSILSQLTTTHITWLGPNCPALFPKNGKLQSAVDNFQKKMGYHYRVIKASNPDKVAYDTVFVVEMDWENKGVAPFYYPWVFELSLADKDGKIVYQQKTNADIRKWLPGTYQVNVDMTVPKTVVAGTYTVCIAIIDPETMKPGVNLEIKGKRSDGRYTLGRVMVG